MPEQPSTLAASGPEPAPAAPAAAGGPDLPGTLSVEELAATQPPDLARLRERIANQQLLVDEAVAAQAVGRQDAPAPADKRKKLRQLEQELYEAERLSALIESARAEMRRRQSAEQDADLARECNADARHHAAALAEAASLLEQAYTLVGEALGPLEGALRRHPRLSRSAKQVATERVQALRGAFSVAGGRELTGQPDLLKQVAATVTGPLPADADKSEATSNPSNAGGGSDIKDLL